jgi:hypothetical protein
MADIKDLKFLGDVDVAGKLTKGNADVLTHNDLVPSDWNQNDGASPDYVRNRTHYITGANLGACIYSEILPKEDFEEYGNYGFSFHVMSEQIVQIKSTEWYVLKIDGVSNYAKTTRYGIFFTGLDIYLSEDSEDSLYCDLTFFLPFKGGEKVELYPVIGTPRFKQLDEKYIPDTIARTEDIKNYINLSINEAIGQALEDNY